MGAIKQLLTTTCAACDTPMPEVPGGMCELCAGEYERDQAEASLAQAVAECQRLRLDVDRVLERIRLEQRRLLPAIKPGTPARDDEMPF